jgi:PPM family protein phosphatase
VSGGVRVVAVTHVGLIRERNEDRVVVGPWILAPDRVEAVAITLDRPPFVAAVLDGMGGHAAGAVAATVAAEVVASMGDTVDDEASAAYLAEWANAAVYEHMQGIPALAGMGSTLAGVAMVDDVAVVFNVGDARVYVEADGYLVQLAVDDSGSGGALTQCLGGLTSYRAVQAHVTTEAVADQRFILASDGLFGHLGEQALEACLVDDDEETVRNLLEAALDGGGPDNVSIAVVRFPGGDR